MSKKIIMSAAAPAPIGPYSQAVAANGMLFISGQVGINQANGTFVTETIEAETAQVMDNIGHILKEAGSDFSKVIKCSIFVKDLNNFAKINEVYGKYFDSNPPARETVEISRLPKDANVEISCIALL
jgi:2-iminobutanoate/2-iminopropanoate deaminase